MATIKDFEIWSQYLYRFNAGNSIDDYMSDTACLSAEKINNVGADFLNDKSKLRERIPHGWLLKEYGIIQNGDARSFNCDSEPIKELLTNGSYVVKDVSESSGDGIYFTHNLSNSEYNDLLNLSFDKKFLVTEFAKQHDYAKYIFPNGANSLRFLVYSPDNEPSRIAACVHKWSTNHSGITDNWNKGGLSTTVVNGVLLDTMEDFTKIEQRGGNGSSREPFYPMIPYRFSYHPESGNNITGIRIPFWNEAIRMVLDASEILRDELPYIGWDIIITDNGPKIIEGNPWPGIQLIQVHYPLFGDLRFKEFMLSHGVEGI